MKIIEIYAERWLRPDVCYIYWAWTIDDAITLFKEQHPDDIFLFAHDTFYSSITKQFQNGSNQVSKG